MKLPILFPDPQDSRIKDALTGARRPMIQVKFDTTDVEAAVGVIRQFATSVVNEWIADVEGLAKHMATWTVP